MISYEWGLPVLLLQPTLVYPVFDIYPECLARLRSSGLGWAGIRVTKFAVIKSLQEVFHINSEQYSKVYQLSIFALHMLYYRLAEAKNVRSKALFDW